MSATGRPPHQDQYLLAAAIAYAYVGASSQVDPDAPDSRFLSLLGLSLAPNFIILVSLSYFFLFRRTLSRTFSITITMLIALEMVVHTLSGSRSAILSIVMSSIFIGLAMSGCIRLRRAYYLVLGAAALPLIVRRCVVSFAISTYNRGVKAVGAFSIAEGVRFRDGGGFERRCWFGRRSDLATDLRPHRILRLLGRNYRASRAVSIGDQSGGIRQKHRR